MNALTITLQAKTPLRLPLAYHYMVQGALYSAWREAFPALHNEGYSDGIHTFRLFTFSPLQGRYSIEGKDILFSGEIRLEVRSPAAELMEELAARTLENGFMRFGRRELPVVDLRTRDRLLFYPSARIRTLGPITVHETLPDGKTLYYSPDEEAFVGLLTANLAAKLRAAGLEAAPVLGFRPTGKPPRKYVTVFKGIHITGYTGEFLLEAEPAAMGLLYYAGLGVRNSQGFGMFDIEAQPLQ